MAKRRNIKKYNNFFSRSVFVIEILWTIKTLATKYNASIPSINPFINNFPEKNNIRNSQRRIKTLSLKKEIRKIIGEKIIITLVDLGKISFQKPNN